MIMYSERLEFSTSSSCTMFGCLNLLRILIYSWIAFYKYGSFSMVLKSTFLTAIFSLVVFSKPSKTLPNEP